MSFFAAKEEEVEGGVEDVEGIGGGRVEVEGVDSGVFRGFSISDTVDASVVSGEIGFGGD